VLRFGVLTLGLGATLLKLWFASRTFGTDDVHLWAAFAQAVRVKGPVGIYGMEFLLPYNHAPLSGWFLRAVNWLVDHQVASFPFLLRVPSSLADLGTGAIVFEALRRRQTLVPSSVLQTDVLAAVCAVLVMWSPVLIIISGFHGNTDPVFVMFALLSVLLVEHTQRLWLAAAAGAAFAVALSIKLVPVVLVPLLGIALLQQGKRRTLAFCAGALALFGPLWGPVLRWRWPQFRANVLDYAGIWVREWGLVQFANWAGLPPAIVELLVTPGRFVVVLLSALVPALIVVRRRDTLAPAAGLALSIFMLLTPAFGMQYMSWALAGACLVSVGAGTLYNVAASVLTVTVYINWCDGALPWNWNEARARMFRQQDFAWMVVAWTALAAVVAVGVWRAARRERVAAPSPAARATASLQSVSRS
jgi:hypothetical protein